LAAKGAKKIYGLDISSEMIEEARKDLTHRGIIDQFELICKDIFDENFELPEKVDCVICSYAISTFINNYDMLASILR
jgi:ubiquinone/menaquinone biosynthesis C-methylase UbiE